MDNEIGPRVNLVRAIVGWRKWPIGILENSLVKALQIKILLLPEQIMLRVDFLQVSK